MVKFPQYILPVLTILRPSPQQHLPEPKHGVVAAVVLCVLTHEVKCGVARADRGHLHYTEAGYWILSAMTPMKKLLSEIVACFFIFNNIGNNPTKLGF